MSIISSNGVGTPKPSYGAISVTPDYTTYYSSASPIVGEVVPTKQPIQVIGLVPVFPCCVDNSTSAVGGFEWDDNDIPGGNIITLVIGTIHFGSFSSAFTDSNATIQARINALLNPSGWSCVVTGATNHRVCTITAPTGTGDVYNGYSVSSTLVGVGTILKMTTMQGGYDNSDPNCDCREGKYNADSIANDHDWTLPVFAETLPSSPPDPYKNDYNTWLFELQSGNAPNTSCSFTLEQFNTTTKLWSTIATLDAFSTLGTYYAPGSLCTNLMWTGFDLNWQKVIALLGEGIYRFRVAMTQIGRVAPCYASPPFCLKEWECYRADKTIRFETTYSGGRIGSVDKKNCTNKFWSFCCTRIKKGGTQGGATPISWRDAIRLPGFFGLEKKDMERVSIKYATGIINKVRDEAIRKFTFISGSIAQTNPGVGYPIWIHDRLSTYGLMADQLYVSDYNMNNPDYSYKKYCIAPDGNYEPEWKFSKRYANVKLQFKAKVQYLIRTRCC